MHKQLEEDSRKDSLPDKKVILGVMMGQGEKSSWREVREPTEDPEGSQVGWGKRESCSVQMGKPSRRGLEEGHCTSRVQKTSAGSRVRELMTYTLGPKVLRWKEW